jgi:hypothetical protein
MAEPDRLEAMLTLQRDLQRDTYGIDFEKMSDEDRMAYVRNNVLALTDELHEALGETGWKPWATSRHVNEQAYTAELVDAWHFLMNLLLVTGIPPEVLAGLFYTTYVFKRGVNEKRQVEGYDGVKTKCPHCKRDLEEVEVGYSKLLNGQLDQLWCGGCEQVLNWMDLPPRVQENLA